jgi:flagellar assembly protein FliH
MSSSAERVTDGVVLRGSAAARATTARFDSELRTHRYLRVGHDPRLLDPSLEQAFADSTAEARAIAEAKGYTKGYAAGRAAASADVAAAAERAAAAAQHAVQSHIERLERTISVLSEAARDLARASVPAYAEAADHLGPAALAIVEALLGRELELAPVDVLDSVRRAVTSSPAAATLTLHLNPQDAATLAELHPQLDAELGRPVRVVADAAVAPGSAVAMHDAARVEVCLESAYERVRQELTA